jgi:hypothetical protein
MVNVTASGENTENWKVLENSVWSRLYSTPDVPGYSDTRLEVQAVTFDLPVDPNGDLSFNNLWNQNNCNWTRWLLGTPVPAVPAPVKETGYRLAIDLSGSSLNAYLNGSILHYYRN